MSYQISISIHLTNIVTEAELNYSYACSGDYVFPEVERMWKSHQSSILASMKDSLVEIGVDGQCDSPGHNATYCTVTAMDCNSNKVLDVQLVNVKEVKNSQCKFLLNNCSQSILILCEITKYRKYFLLFFS